MKKQQLITLGFIGLSLYLISAGLSFAGFSYFGGSTEAAPGITLPDDKNNPKTGFQVDPGAPKTEVCPINGQMFTTAEKDIWQTRRPLAVMIENHEESRPQSGLSSADVVYEAVAEGGITRFMGIFYCGAATPVTLAPVRSARVYYLPWVLEYDALYNHVGGAGRCNDDTVDERAKALCRIEEWKVKDMDQFGISFPTCYRNYDRLDHPVATEHTMVCFSDKLFKLAAERGWTNTDASGTSWDKNYRSWKFKDEAKGAGTVSTISYVAWKGYESSYGVKWDYDSATNTYKRSNGGAPHEDLEIKQQLSPKAVIVQFAKEIGPVDTHAHLLYNNIGTGDGLLFQDGTVTKIAWSKPNRLARTIFSDEKGKEIQLNRGQIWISMLPVGTVVSY